MFAHRPFKRAAQEPKDTGQIEVNDDFVIGDVDAAVYLLSSSSDEKVHPILVRPLRFDGRHSRREIAADFMRMGVHPAANFFAAKLVRKRDTHV